MVMSSTEHDELREQAALYVLGALTPADRDAFESTHGVVRGLHVRREIAVASHPCAGLRRATARAAVRASGARRSLGFRIASQSRADCTSSRYEAGHGVAVACGRRFTRARRGARDVLAEPPLQNRRARAEAAGSHGSGRRRRTADSPACVAWPTMRNHNLRCSSRLTCSEWTSRVSHERHRRRRARSGADRVGSCSPHRIFQRSPPARPISSGC